MKLWEYSGKKVRLITDDNQVFQGTAYDYSPPQDNEPEIATISIDVYEFREDEIKSIEVIE